MLYDVEQLRAWTSGWYRDAEEHRRARAARGHDGGMDVRLLTPDQAAGLRAQPLTYPEIGATAGDPPAGYRTLRRTAVLPAGTSFARVADDLLGWRVQQRAGLRVAAGAHRVEVDGVVVLGLGVGPLAVRAPCRVVRVVDERGRAGFAYGTLPGHPQRGEEDFLLEQREDGAITFTITAFSRPATAPARLGGPVGRLLQDLVIARYLRALGG